eukprot:scaffold34830_cov199-Amphora_coffeaeformis.AAC.1
MKEDIEVVKLTTELFGSSPEVEPKEKMPPTKASFRKTLGLGETKTPIEQLPDFPAVIGHRGALYAELENTIPSFVKCAEWGCAGVELDVFTLKDGAVVVFHGAGTDEGPGWLRNYCLNQDNINILDLTYPEVQELRFDPNFDDFPCEANKITTARIPLLSEVLQALRGTGLEIKIELKHPNTVAPVLEIVDSLGMNNQCSYSSFNHANLLELRKLRPSLEEYPTGALFKNPLPPDYLERAKACGATQVHLMYNTCTVERVEETRRAGLRSMAWLRGPMGMASDCQETYFDLSNEGEDCYYALWETGVDQICCNRPDVALSLRDGKENIMM